MAEIDLLHRLPPSKRNLAERHAAQQEAKDVASRFGVDYFDGDRKYGYGGYRYDGRWIPVAETIRDHFGLKAGDRVLDVGCAKGFLVADLMTVVPGLEAAGIDISEYALANAHAGSRTRVARGDARCLPFGTGGADCAISLNTLHNLDRADCVAAVSEIERVAPGRGYIVVDSYRTPEQRAVFMRWVLTAKMHDYPRGWETLFAEAGYTGDYYWTIIE